MVCGNTRFKPVLLNFGKNFLTDY
ncbi:hypothetical protein BDFB_014430 [Asbolus verrucosus]|uniref:Uncharacterized protein n=1 Tax=Asbolus verrucosus TaxID=1661398 RepID=A0A482W9V3_ASBVE|nr:hypothetical protein BDFB_014430 [Asbolus verrucosus]